MFGFQERFVFRWEWLTLLPDSSPFAQNSQTFAMCYTSFILRDTVAPKHNINILPQMMRPCKYFCLTMPLWHESHVKGALSHSVIVSIVQPLAAWMMASADFSGTGS